MNRTIEMLNTITEAPRRARLSLTPAADDRSVTVAYGHSTAMAEAFSKVGRMYAVVGSAPQPQPAHRATIKGQVASELAEIKAMSDDDLAAEGFRLKEAVAVTRSDLALEREQHTDRGRIWLIRAEKFLAFTKARAALVLDEAAKRKTIAAEQKKREASERHLAAVTAATAAKLQRSEHAASVSSAKLQKLEQAAADKLQRAKQFVQKAHELLSAETTGAIWDAVYADQKLEGDRSHD